MYTPTLPLPEVQIFVPFVLRWAVLELHGFFRKVHRMTPNHLDIFKVKNTNMHATYIAEAQIYIRFALRWAIFELRPNLWKSAPNDPKWPWHEKYQHACYKHPWGPKFLSVSHYDGPFFGPIFGKVHQMTPNDLDMFQVKNTNMYATYTHKGQIFNLFHSTMSCFWVPAYFLERIAVWYIICEKVVFLPQVVEIELIFALRAPASKIRDDFQNCHIWAWNLAVGQSCTYTLFLP